MENEQTDNSAEIDALVKQRDELLTALKGITEDYAERFDMESPSTNPGMKFVVAQAKAAIDAAMKADK